MDLSTAQTDALDTAATTTTITTVTTITTARKATAVASSTPATTADESTRGPPPPEHRAVLVAAEPNASAAPASRAGDAPVKVVADPSGVQQEFETDDVAAEAAKTEGDMQEEDNKDDKHKEKKGISDEKETERASEREEKRTVNDVEAPDVKDGDDRQRSEDPASPPAVSSDVSDPTALVLSPGGDDDAPEQVAAGARDAAGDVAMPETPCQYEQETAEVSNSEPTDNIAEVRAGNATDGDADANAFANADMIAEANATITADTTADANSTSIANTDTDRIATVNTDSNDDANADGNAMSIADPRADINAGTISDTNAETIPTSIADTNTDVSAHIHDDSNDVASPISNSNANAVSISDTNADINADSKDDASPTPNSDAISASIADNNADTNAESNDDVSPTSNADAIAITNADTIPDTSAVSEADSITDANVDSKADDTPSSNTQGNATSQAHARADVEDEANTDTNPDTNPDVCATSTTNTSADAIADASAKADAHVDLNVNVDVDPSANANADSNTDAYVDINAVVESDTSATAYDNIKGDTNADDNTSINVASRSEGISEADAIVDSDLIINSDPHTDAEDLTTRDVSSENKAEAIDETDIEEGTQASAHPHNQVQAQAQAQAQAESAADASIRLSELDEPVEASAVGTEAGNLVDSPISFSQQEGIASRASTEIDDHHETPTEDSSQEVADVVVNDMTAIDISESETPTPVHPNNAVPGMPVEEEEIVIKYEEEKDHTRPIESSHMRESPEETSGKDLPPLISSVEAAVTFVSNSDMQPGPDDSETKGRELLSNSPHVEIKTTEAPRSFAMHEPDTESTLVQVALDDVDGTQNQEAMRGAPGSNDLSPTIVCQSEFLGSSSAEGVSLGHARADASDAQVDEVEELTSPASSRVGEHSINALRPESVSPPLTPVKAFDGLEDAATQESLIVTRLETSEVTAEGMTLTGSANHLPMPGHVAEDISVPRQSPDPVAGDPISQSSLAHTASTILSTNAPIQQEKVFLEDSSALSKSVDMFNLLPDDELEHEPAEPVLMRQLSNCPVVMQRSSLDVPSTDTDNSGSDPALMPDKAREEEALQALVDNAEGKEEVQQEMLENRTLRLQALDSLHLETDPSDRQPPSCDTSVLPSADMSGSHDALSTMDMSMPSMPLTPELIREPSTDASFSEPSSERLRSIAVLPASGDISGASFETWPEAPPIPSVEALEAGVHEEEEEKTANEAGEEDETEEVVRSETQHAGVLASGIDADVQSNRGMETDISILHDVHEVTMPIKDVRDTAQAQIPNLPQFGTPSGTTAAESPRTPRNRVGNYFQEDGVSTDVSEHQTTEVITTPTGKYFHRNSNCYYLRSASRLIHTRNVRRGLEKCPRCYRETPTNIRESDFITTATGRFYHSRANCYFLRSAGMLIYTSTPDSRLLPCTRCL